MSSEHYVPQHPLPEEIQSLSRDDTVCQYCGVSYLIHNEIKRLEEKLKEYEKELNRMKSFDEREEKLKSEVNILTKKSEDLLSKWQEEHDRFENISKLLKEKDDEISSLKEKLKSNENTTKILLKETSIAKQKNKQFHVWATQAKVSLSKLKSTQQDFVKFFLEIKQDLNVHRSKTETLMLEKVQSLKLFAAKCEKNNEMLQLEMTRLKKRKKQELEALKEQQEQNKSKIEEHYKTKLKANEQMLNDCSAKLKKSEEEQNNLTQKIRNLKLDHSSISEKLATLTESSQSEIETLTMKLNGLQEDGNKDKKDLLANIQKLKGQNERLMEEREKMVDAHQCRIQELRESFLEKMKEAEQWPGKLEDEVGRLTEAFQMEKHELQKHLKESHEQDLRRLEKDFQQKSSKEKSNIHSKEAKFKTDLLTMQARCEKKVKDLQDQIEIIKSEYEEINASSQSIIQDMLQKLREHEETRETNGSKNELNSQTQLEELQRILELTKEKLQERNKMIGEHEKEVQVLRDCVRRECEERYELTESLAEARTELLSMHRYYGNSNNLKRTINPSPPSYDRKHSSSYQEESRRSLNNVNLANGSDGNGGNLKSASNFTVSRHSKGKKSSR